MTRTTYAPSAPGWIRVTPYDGDAEYLVRCAEQASGRLVVVQVLIKTTAGVSSATLRDVPVGRIETTINAEAELAAHARLDGEADELLARLWQTPPRWIIRQNVKGEPLERPDGSDPEAFYGRVAERYRALVRDTSKPAMAIAEEANVPPATARRWINEARRRGLLPAGRQGRAQ